MGTCWSCNTELTLGEDRTTCDVCGEILFYHCNNCAEKFEVGNKNDKSKLKICKLCGYFKCPNCSVCYSGCKKFNWEREILKILRPEVTQGNCENILKKVREIVKYFEEEKISIDRKNCPERKVPISYAKTKIKSLLAKVDGFRVKNEADKDAFVKRIEEITDLPIDSELTINKVRKEGSYGQEYLDAFNLLVCMGKLEIKERKFLKGKQEIKYKCFVRCEKESCFNLDVDGLIITYCESCRTRYPRGTIYCSKCKPYSKGKQIGEQRKLKERLSDKDSCQLYRGLFNKNK